MTGASCFLPRCTLKMRNSSSTVKEDIRYQQPLIKGNSRDKGILFPLQEYTVKGTSPLSFPELRDQYVKDVHPRSITRKKKKTTNKLMDLQSPRVKIIKTKEGSLGPSGR